jgi:hypothetical protein
MFEIEQKCNFSTELRLLEMCGVNSIVLYGGIRLQDGIFIRQLMLQGLQELRRLPYLLAISLNIYAT